jgi:hypothetical protein
MIWINPPPIGQRLNDQTTARSIQTRASVMTAFDTLRARAWAASALIIAVAGAAAAATAPGPVAGVGTKQTVTEKATVRSIDMATRHAVLVDPSGQTYTVKVGDHVQNLGKVKPGQVITATYNRSLLLVFSTRGAALPADTDAVIAGRVAKGELPAAAVANHVVITETVLGVDPHNHTLQLVKPKGGEVQTVKVADAATRMQLARVKVGDTITAYQTEALLIAVGNP